MENFVPTKPAFKGTLQTRTQENKFVTQGEIDLWVHDGSRYYLRGYVTINGTKYYVSLEELVADEE